jgi:homoserine dehydrogenase
VCLLGFGNVARAFCELLARQRGPLADRHGLEVLITAVGTRHGSLVVPDGLTADGLLARAIPLPGPPLPAADLVAASDADVLVELTVMEQDHAPLATAHIETAFDLGLDVVTANKGPIAWNWRRIQEKAAAAGRRIRFESTVMDGLPVFSLLETALPDCRLLGFDAVFNATTNTMIEAMAGGSSFESALGAMQAAGCAEADPANDVDGWDAAYKAAALANVTMGAAITPRDIARVSLRDVTEEQITRAWAAGKRLRLVTSMRRDDRSGAHGGMSAEELAIGHPLAGVGASALGAVLHTDLMGPVAICELEALVPQTAYGVYADLLHLYGGR